MHPDVQKEIKRLEDILLQSPKDLSTLWALADIYREDNIEKKAKELLFKIIEIDSTNADAHYNLGVLFDEEENYTEAKQHYLKAIDINPNYADAHNNLGVLFYQEKNYTEAKRHHLKVIDINPNDAEAHYNLGNVFLAEKNYTEAKQHYLKAIDLNPNDAEAHYNLGNVFLAEKNYTEAKKYWLKAIDINPNHAGAHYNLGVLFAEEKNYTEAIQHYLKALEVNPNHADAHYNLGVLFYEEKNYTEAKQHYLKAIDINPNNAEARNNLGTIFLAEKNYTEAKKHYLKAIDINHQFGHSHFNLALLYKETGDIAQFTKHYLIATEIDAILKIDEWEEEIERPPVLLSIARFGAIKNIKIQLKRLTVFIGQQGQGKSTVAKLICIIESLKTQIAQGNATPELLQTLFVKEISNYGLHDYLQPNSFFRWENGVSHIEYKDGAFSFSNIVYANSEFLYVPAERNFVAVAAGAMQNLLLNEVPIMRSLLKFGAEFEKARARFTDQDIPFLGVKYRYNNGTDYIESGTEGNKSSIKMSESASSHQAIVPMYVCMRYWNEKYDKSMLVVEEPELNLFPTSQKALIGFIIENCLFAKPNNQLIITTHSPYTLTSLNNLMQADNTHRLKPKLIDEILAIVPFEKWVDAKHIAAYHLKEGDAIDIFNKEYRIIADSGIDEVSDILNEEFNQLLDLLNQ